MKNRLQHKEHTEKQMTHCSLQLLQKLNLEWLKHENVNVKSLKP